MTSRRLFLAVDLPPSAKEACGRITRELKKTGADVRWVEDANFHVTLKFLGDVTEDRVQDIADACAATGKNHRIFSFSLSGLGAFPSVTAPRVLWVGVRTAEQPFEHLAQDLDDALARIGFDKEERTFHPHVTIGRVRSPRNRVHLIEVLAENKDAFLPQDIPAHGITLFESQLTPQGAVYTAVQTLPLAA